MVFMETKAQGLLDMDGWQSRTPAGAELTPLRARALRDTSLGTASRETEDTGLHVIEGCTLGSEGIRVAPLCEAAECHPQALEDLGPVPATRQQTNWVESLLDEYH